MNHRVGLCVIKVNGHLGNSTSYRDRPNKDGTPDFIEDLPSSLSRPKRTVMGICYYGRIWTPDSGVQIRGHSFVSVIAWGFELAHLLCET